MSRVTREESVFELNVHKGGFCALPEGMKREWPRLSRVEETRRLRHFVCMNMCGLLVKEKTPAGCQNSFTENHMRIKRQ